jgi:molybdopterin-containing oxidoreductase family iron-sulfur binding subunit
MSNSRQYWQSVEQVENNEEFVAKNSNEFAEDLPLEQFLGKEELNSSSTSRRDFLKFVGFSVTAATLAACEAPVMKSIPYVVKPEEVTPGVANYYASSYYDGFDFAPILIKTREGRPIHIEGNKAYHLNNGGVNARVNSSLLSLYDTARVKSPQLKGQDTSWDKVDATVKGALASSGTVRILTHSIISPSTEALMGQLAASLPNADVKHVTYDAYSSAGMIAANKADFGVAGIPNLQFENADTVVSFGADFLSTWLNATQYAAGYGKNRKPVNGKMSRHYQFESNYSITGTNADIRGAVMPNEQGLAIIELYNHIAKATGNATVKGGKLNDDNDLAGKLKNAAKDLLKSKNRSLVVASSNDAATQQLVNGINNMLGAIGTTVDLTRGLKTRQANDVDFANLVKEMNAGKVDTLIIYGVNPVYSAPAALGFEKALSKVKTSVSFSMVADETGSACTVLAPDNHYFENWNDYEPITGELFVAQPVIRPLFVKTAHYEGTRQAQESLMAWAGISGTYYDYMRNNWENAINPTHKDHTLFEDIWNQTVHDGYITVPRVWGVEGLTYAGNAAAAAPAVVKASKANGLVAELYVETAMGLGNQANNPWLQELPNPLTKVTWDNYVAMSVADCKERGFATKYGQQLPASLANVTINGVTVKLPVIALPGQRKGAVSIALGYGRTKAGKVVEQGDLTAADGSKTIGANAFGMVSAKGQTMSYVVDNVTVELAEEKEYPVGLAQTHFTEMDRKIVNETSLQTMVKGKDVYNPDMTVTDAYGEVKKVSEVDLWAVQDIANGHRWGMTIDLSTCIGCNACVTSCHSENNVPVVGKDEVRRNRIMSWLRVDRYFSSGMSKVVAEEQGGISTRDMYIQMEDPADYPEAVHQPVMCQQCNHAPCETVCPVAATTHSNEGLNQMTYNRCIGTRYCANNCPYKVRRFNWFNYVGDSKFTEVNPSQSDFGRMVLNPDVVVRARGVMEKCSFCVQRIQEGKLSAKKEGRTVADGDVVSACSSVCPTNAIKFGDLNDNHSTVAMESQDDRSYNLLEEVGTQPNVFYMTKVRNIDEERIPAGIGHGAHHGDNHGHDSHGEESHDAHTEEAHSEEHTAH